MNEYSAQQRAALATVALLIDGPQRARELNRRLYDDEEGGYDMLTNIGGVVSLSNDHGWWHVNIAKLSTVPYLLDAIDDRIEETCEGAAYCRPMKRTDMLQLRELLQHFLKIGRSPE